MSTLRVNNLDTLNETGITFAKGLRSTGSSTVGSTGFAWGDNVSVSGNGFAHGYGNFVPVLGLYAHAEGFLTTASVQYSHAEGQQTRTLGIGSHTEGYLTITNGAYSHAEGKSTSTNAGSAHAEGSSSLASGVASHAEGRSTVASGEASHAEGRQTTASGDYSHTEGYQTEASGTYQLVVGQHNEIISDTAAFIIGNGNNVGGRSNLAVFASESITFDLNAIPTSSLGLSAGQLYRTGSDFDDIKIKLT